MKMKKSAGMFLAAAVTAMIGVGGIAAPANAATLDDPNAQAMLSMVNQHRANNGLAPVVWNQSIADVAQYWSPIAAQDLAEDGVLDNPHNDNYFGMYPSGATSGSENVAWGQSIEGVFNQWVNSPAHNANMLNPNTNTFGFGYVVGHDPAYPGMIMATQNFATYPNVDTGATPTLVANASSDTALAGQTVTLYGTLTNATSSVSVWVDASYVMEDWSNQNLNQNYVLTPDANGNFQITVTVPEGVRTGTINAGFRSGSLSANTVVNVLETPTPEVPVEPTPEVPTPEVPVEPTPEVPTPEVPVEPTPEVPTPEVPTPEVPTPEVPTPEVPTPEVPVTPTPEVPTPEVPVTPTPEVPTPEVPVTPTPEVPTPEVPVTPTPEVPTPEVPVTPTPEVPTPEVPVTPTPEAPTPEVPVTPTPEVPVEPTPEVPVETTPEAPVKETPEAPAGVINPVKNEAPVLNAVDNGIFGSVDDVLSGAVVLDETNRGSFEMVTSADGKMLTVTGLTPGVTYEIWLHSNPLFAGEYVADADGAVSVSIPEDLENGNHKAVIYVDGELMGWQDFSKGEELAYTGANGTQMLTLGFAGMILLAGGALMAVGRRGFSKN